MVKTHSNPRYTNTQYVNQVFRTLKDKLIEFPKIYDKEIFQLLEQTHHTPTHKHVIKIERHYHEMKRLLNHIVRLEPLCKEDKNKKSLKLIENVNNKTS